ncbi:MAG TPA: MerR family transcriptional regulator [Micromonosporaceae bacterium]
MSIGEVLAHLRPEFPDTTVSKLRFLEAEGLVEPQRTPAGYRKYSWDDVARLRYVLTAQRDHYLPLRVIRDQLAALDRTTPAVQPPRPALTAVGSTGTPPPPPAGTDGPDGRLTRADLLARSGLDDALLAQVEALGLVAPRAPGWYDADALSVAYAVAGLALYGLEPRHLRAFRSAADREAGLFAQLVAPLARQQDPVARARAAETVRELIGLSQQLHAALLRAALREASGR